MLIAEYLAVIKCGGGGVGTICIFTNSKNLNIIANVDSKNLITLTENNNDNDNMKRYLHNLCTLFINNVATDSLEIATEHLQIIDNNYIQSFIFYGINLRKGAIYCVLQAYNKQLKILIYCYNTVQHQGMGYTPILYLEQHPELQAKVRERLTYFINTKPLIFEEFIKKNLGEFNKQKIIELISNNDVDYKVYYSDAEPNEDISKWSDSKTARDYQKTAYIDYIEKIKQVEETYDIPIGIGPGKYNLLLSPNKQTFTIEVEGEGKTYVRQHTLLMKKDDGRIAYLFGGKKT